MFLTKEAVRLAIDGTAAGVACEGCPPLADLLKRYEAAGGRYYVCPICFTARNLSPAALIGGAESRAPSRCGPGSATRPPPPSATDPVSGADATSRFSAASALFPIVGRSESGQRAVLYAHDR